MLLEDEDTRRATESYEMLKRRLHSLILDFQAKTASGTEPSEVMIRLKEQITIKKQLLRQKRNALR